MFKFERMESGMSDIQLDLNLQQFVCCLTSVYPNVKKVKKRNNGKWKILYRGIAVKTLQPIVRDSDSIFKNIIKSLPPNYMISSVTDKEVVCSTESGHFSNGNAIVKKVTFYDNGTWDLSIFGRCVNLNRVQVLNTFTYEEFSINTVCSVVKLLNVCEGVLLHKTVSMSRYHTLEQFQKQGTTTSKRTIRSLNCQGIVPFTALNNTCKSCRCMTFSCPTTKKENYNSESGKSEENENLDKIKNLLKNANPELVNLFLEQSKNIARKPNARRWSESFISLCLQLYNRSPHAYEILLSSKILTLPSPTTLTMFKNKFKQETGFDPSVFKWMLEEIKRRGIPEEGMISGIIFDEMAIQADVQICKNGDIVELVGFTELGEEGDICNSLRVGFIMLCNQVLKSTNVASVTPGLINSDVIENVFNMQRSTYRGANTNPNAFQYRKTLNSILVGQNVVSRKSNAGTSASALMPFNVKMKSKDRKRKSAVIPSNKLDIKVIRV
ncbi:hypothetical protein ACF0H5_023461 [Mactra antiquata]